MTRNKIIQEVKIKRYRNGNVRVLNDEIEVKEITQRVKFDLTGLLSMIIVIVIGIFIGMIAGLTYGENLSNYFGFMTFAAAIFLTLAIEIKDGNFMDGFYARPIKMGTKTVFIYKNRNTNDLKQLVVVMLFLTVGIATGIVFVGFIPLIATDLHMFEIWLFSII
jgi:hypothetical protein